MTSLRRSVAVMLALAGVLTVTSAARAASLFGVDVFEVYDSTGKKLGRVSHTDGTAYGYGVLSAEVPFRTASGHTVFVNVWPRMLLGTEQWVWFTGPGCSGRPFLAGSTPFFSGRQPASALIGPRQTVYVQTGPYRRGTMGSFSVHTGKCWDIDAEYPAPDFFAPAARLGIDIADYFTPPFSLRSIPGDPIPTGAAGEPLDRTDRLVVIDSAGKKVTSAAAYAVVTDSGITIPLNGVGDYWRTGFFASTDCSGPMFFIRAAGVLGPQTNVFGPRDTVFQPSRFERRTMHSSRVGDECSILRYRVGPQAWRTGVTADFAPGTPLGIDLDDYFTGPFTVRAGRGTPSLPTPTAPVR